MASRTCTMNRLLIILLKVYFLVVGASGDLVSRHDGRPTVAAVNATVTFVCHSHDQSARWEHFKVSSTQPNNVYNGFRVSTAYIRTHTVVYSYNTGDSVLTMSRIQAADGGKYRCFKPSVSVADEFELIVYDASPICSCPTPFQSIRENEQLSVYCEINYIGNANPGFECAAHNEGSTDSASIPVNASCAGIGNETISASEEMCKMFYVSSAKLSVFETFRLAKCVQKLCVDRRLHDKRLSCAVYFEAANGSRSRGLTTSNSWKNDVLNVLYGPTAVSIDVSNGTTLDGDSVLSCTADSNPSPAFTWTQVTAAESQPEEHNGSTLIFDVCRTPDRSAGNQLKRTKNKENTNTVYTEVILRCTATALNHSAVGQITVSGWCELEQQTTSAVVNVFQRKNIDPVTERVAAVAGAVNDASSTPSLSSNTDDVRLALIVCACVLFVGLIGCGVVIAILLRKRKSQKPETTATCKVDCDVGEHGREVGSYIDPFQHEYVEITDLPLPPPPTDNYLDPVLLPQLPPLRNVYEQIGSSADEQTTPAVYSKLSSSSAPGDNE